MACNCGTQEEIDKLYRAYGEKLANYDDLNLVEKVKWWFFKILTIFAWIIVFPLMLIYLLFFLFWNDPGDRKINVQNFNLLKILHKGKYARE